MGKIRSPWVKSRHLSTRLYKNRNAEIETDAAPSLLYRMILVLLDANGLLRTEASRIKVENIDSKRMESRSGKVRVPAIGMYLSHQVGGI